MTQSNRERFRQVLESHYVDLFANDPAYAYAAKVSTAHGLSHRMTNAITAGTASIDGDGIKRTCETLGIKPTFKAIREYMAT